GFTDFIASAGTAQWGQVSFLDRARDTPEQMGKLYDYLIDRGVVGVGSELYKGVSIAASGFAEWFASDIPALAIERQIDNAATMSANEIGGLTFDNSLGALTGFAGGKAIQLVGGKWIPLAGKALNDLLDKQALQALQKSGGMHTPDGRQLLDFGSLTNDQKRVVGEMFGENSIKSTLPDGQKLARVQGSGTNGIDDLYRVDRPDVDFVVIEYKYGKSKLENTKDLMQMSDTWLTGARTGFNRIEEAVANPSIAADISSSLGRNRVERWLVHTDPNGGVPSRLLIRRERLFRDQIWPLKSLDVDIFLNQLENLLLLAGRL
ncbi:hypothetical protein, partial [Xanthomonas campestris]|uniref:hypothetical protein n=1 Tax=Xanthomonas campestris TaxID=339 RepID=UPI001C847C2F